MSKFHLGFLYHPYSGAFLIFLQVCIEELVQLTRQKEKR
ncbi:hypothetical protein GCHA_0959 [Paraglaciecola chathamensis S18K6]|uniref:Uncharacterized protein n=1 Tax=Paraglaciecola chathamensis S18K6 TaxID=1127672 RepID=A0AAV3UV40_9ALTE|nr:hypothetical protein GCHA_0959 [Paraglaciecola chathamensis S18K6]